MKYKPNEQIINKAVELWKQMLLNPKFDNGDSSTTGDVAAIMTMTLPSNTTQELLNQFGANLKKVLMTENKLRYYETYLDVDYSPCTLLADAAKKAGLETQFPWKTAMHITENHFTLSCGYGAESKYYYPLKDERWLITKLSGSDVDKIIKYIEEGNIIPGFTTEKDN